VREVDSPRDQDVFGLITSSFKKLGLKPTDITSIKVNPGPGSFTGTRIGVSIANALGFALKVPVNGNNLPTDPIYSSPPSITQPKKVTGSK
jgi:tRNA A37 threonylcarbamoyltransferase TsaD